MISTSCKIKKTERLRECVETNSTHASCKTKTHTRKPQPIRKEVVFERTNENLRYSNIMAGKRQ